MSNEIVRSIDVAAPIARVWQAVSDADAFGAWFRVALDGPFVAGQPITGRITHPGYEHLRWTADVLVIDPPHRFVFAWHPYAIDPTVDYSQEPQTEVEFLLVAHGTGTRVTITERGFDALPASRRDEAYRMNAGGWEQQVRNLAAHVDG